MNDQAALNIIAQQMPDEEIVQLKKVFTSMDTNGDGQLTIQEVVEGIQKSGECMCAMRIVDVVVCVQVSRIFQMILWTL